MRLHFYNIRIFARNQAYGVPFSPYPLLCPPRHSLSLLCCNILPPPQLHQHTCRAMLQTGPVQQLDLEQAGTAAQPAQLTRQCTAVAWSRQQQGRQKLCKLVLPGKLSFYTEEIREIRIDIPDVCHNSVSYGQGCRLRWMQKFKQRFCFKTY